MDTFRDNPNHHMVMQRMAEARAMRRAVMAEALRDLLRPLTGRYAAWSERRQRRLRVIRELQSYSDDELAELRIPRADIPGLASRIA